MKISLVTPCYNAARFIRETLQSVADQGYSDLEYLVVDGGSTDGTCEIISEFAPHLSWFVSERDDGQASALNKGLRQSAGDILGFLNADDVLNTGALQAVASAFASDPSVDIVYGGVEWMGADSERRGEHHGKISSLEEILDIYRVWWGKRQWVQPEVFFRRTLWDRVGDFDTSYHLAFDFDYWVRCFLAGARVRHIEDRLVRFRLHEAQKSSASRRAADEIRAIVERALESARISAGLKRRLTAQLSYDRFQAGEGRERGSFLRALVSHPYWLYAPEARARVRAACLKRLSGPTTETKLHP